MHRPKGPHSLFSDTLLGKPKNHLVLAVIGGRPAAEMRPSNYFGYSNNRYIPIRETSTTFMTFPLWEWGWGWGWGWG